MRVFVLGSTGMLGRYVYTYLNHLDKYNVVEVTRRELDARTCKPADLESGSFKKGDIVINCIGLIKQNSDTSKHDYIAVNTLFPLMLSDFCEINEINFIHVTTDCVFSGKEGNYSESSKHDAKDIYGVSKSLGEPDNCTVVRTSIIGEELKGKLSLLEWVRSNAGKEINGFTNHWWNGITCLQYAKVCENIIDNELYWKGTTHVHSPTAINKYDLSKMISDTFDLGINVNKFETPESCDRTLVSEKPPIFDIPELYDQVQEMKNFGPILRGQA